MKHPLYMRIIKLQLAAMKNKVLFAKINVIPHFAQVIQWAKNSAAYVTKHGDAASFKGEAFPPHVLKAAQEAEGFAAKAEQRYGEVQAARGDVTDALENCNLIFSSKMSITKVRAAAAAHRTARGVPCPPCLSRLLLTLSEHQPPNRARRRVPLPPMRLPRAS